jgi:RecA/RadA recombinase
MNTQSKLASLGKAGLTKSARKVLLSGDSDPDLVAATKELLNTMLDASIADVKKKMGLAGTAFDPDEPRLHTGLLSLDLLIGGGIVSGGWYTIFGGEQSAKTTIAMMLMASIIAQGFDGKASYWDYEGSGSPDYIENILKSQGVKQTLSQIFGEVDPDTGEELTPPLVDYISTDVGEEFFEFYNRLKRMLPDKVKIGKNYFFLFPHDKQILKRFMSVYDKKYLTKHNKIKVPAENGMMQAIALLDSYPAMLSRYEDTDDGSNAMALQARMFSKEIKRIKGAMKKKRMTVFGVNQTRQRPATMFGCLHANTKVEFVDGTVHTMKNIVDQKIEGEVWSFNELTSEIEARRITDWHYNGDVEDRSHWMKIISRCSETGKGQAFVICTPNHEILTDNGWKRADEIRLTDKLVSKYYSANANFWMTKDGSSNFFSLSAKYVPEGMQYKLPREFRGMCADFDLTSEEHKRPVYVEVLRIEGGSDRAFRDKGKYDISVEHNHNYMVGNKSNGIIVHNSPEYEPCGEALKFFSDVRIKSTSRALLKGWGSGKGMTMDEKSVQFEGNDEYRFINLKVIKNKLGGLQYQDTFARIWIRDADGTAKGLDPVFDTWNFLKMLGMVGGQRNNMKFSEDCPLHGAKKCTWLAFKTLILGKKPEIKKQCIDLGVRPVDIRVWCKHQISKGTVLKKFALICAGKGDMVPDETD